MDNEETSPSMTPVLAAQSIENVYANPQATVGEKIKALRLATEFGGQAWMFCSEPAQLEPLVGALKSPQLKTAFLESLSRVVNAPNNTESTIAAALRPYVDKEIARLRVS